MRVPNSMWAWLSGEKKGKPTEFEIVLSVVEAVASMRGQMIGARITAREITFPAYPGKMIAIECGGAQVTITPHEVVMNATKDNQIALIEEKFKILECKIAWRAEVHA